MKYLPLLILSISFAQHLSANPFSCPLTQQEPDKEVLKLDRIHYKGYAFNDDKSYVIIGWKNEEYILKQTEQLERFRLLRITPKYIELKRDHRIYRIQVESDKNALSPY